MDNVPFFTLRAAQPHSCLKRTSKAIWFCSDFIALFLPGLANRPELPAMGSIVYRGQLCFPAFMIKPRLSKSKQLFSKLCVTHHPTTPHNILSRKSTPSQLYARDRSHAKAFWRDCVPEHHHTALQPY